MGKVHSPEEDDLKVVVGWVFQQVPEQFEHLALGLVSLDLLPVGVEGLESARLRPLLTANLFQGPDHFRVLGDEGLGYEDRGKGAGCANLETVSSESQFFGSNSSVEM